MSERKPCDDFNVDPLLFYDLERYLFEHVRPTFAERGRLTAFEFFSIVMWKSNRSKPAVAKRLLKQSKIDSLEDAVEMLTTEIATAGNREERFSVVFDRWEFALPMTSAILTVLYPDDFTVYDWRVCEQLGDFEKLVNKTSFKNLWPEYEQFVKAVHDATPANLSLRDKDRHLIARSISCQLESDIQRKFKKRKN